MQKNHFDSASQRESAHSIPNSSQIKFADEEDVDDEIERLEDEEELEYPDLDELKIDTDENDDDWN